LPHYFEERPVLIVVVRLQGLVALEFEELQQISQSQLLYFEHMLPLEVEQMVREAAADFCLAYRLLVEPFRLGVASHRCYIVEALALSLQALEQEVRLEALVLF
jgi:hypothetical protein